MGDAATATLAVTGLRSGYGPVEVVRGIDLSVIAGTVTAIIGPNGAGKSTLCKTLAGVVPAIAGRIVVNGEDLTAQPCWLRVRRGVVLVPEGRGVFPHLNVEENLGLLLPNASDRARVYERFTILGERRRQDAGTLSGGEQQLLSVAPMLVHKPSVLIADEPTLGLSPRRSVEIIELFAEIRAGGAAVVLVGESPRGIADVADRIALLHAGRIEWTGTPNELTPETLEEAYFGHASTDGLRRLHEGPA